MTFVHLLPSLIPAGALRGGVAVVIDVLRASTMIVHALAAGCDAVIPCGEIDEARRIAGGLPPGSALLAGERHGVPIEGFDLGNSPGACTADVCRGKTLVMTTTNGTKAILASLDAEVVLVGAFVNFAATAQRLLHEKRPVHLVCAGTEGAVSYEDALLAGAFAGHFADLEHTLDNDEAEIVRGLWARVEDAVWFKGGGKGHAKTDDDRPLTRYLKRGAGGRRVMELGFEADIADAAALNRGGYQLAVELRRDPLRLVAAS
ncbi:MAG: 2-phosphosulfolactate phosphatase [Paludisphaera borealis]|uniref:2-phosphosulfolactate phosphatase n=1 Tax=Paludisphaera borealis TaxID=1387353 RepID=UPI00284B1E96|nr:2-phosphosulfolactate phosphatase [Paludisphaera borealis]MDR3623029.1 2-phosphosulfolactate phosphatase [Paludisphaera borealis]